MSNDFELTPAMFQILLALSEGDSHGYAIMQEIERRTGGEVELGAGTLYRSIKQLLAAGLISEKTKGQATHGQRRYYGLTPTGRRKARAEARKLHGIVEWARDTRLFDPRKA